MDNILDSYLKTKSDLKNYFNFHEDYFIKILPYSSFEIEQKEDLFFLKYSDNNEKEQKTIIVKKDNEPCIYEKSDYTMIVGVDCVKIAFIFDNKNKKS